MAEEISVQVPGPVVALSQRLAQAGHQAYVVGGCVRVDTARAEPVEAEARDTLADPLRRGEAMQPRTRERAVENEAGLDRHRPVGPAAVEREHKRDTADEMRRDDPRQ